MFGFGRSADIVEGMFWGLFNEYTFFIEQAHEVECFCIGRVADYDLSEIFCDSKICFSFGAQLVMDEESDKFYFALIIP